MRGRNVSARRRTIAFLSALACAASIARESRAEDLAPLWSTATLSQARLRLAGTRSSAGVAYFGGGQSADAPTYSNVVDTYDPLTNTWGTLSLSQPRAYLGAASAGNKVLFAGGVTTGNVNSAVVDVWDTSTSSWSTTTLSLARAGVAAGSAGGKAIFGGGANPTRRNNVDIYDSATNIWSTATLSSARSDAAAASWGNKIYIAGGSDNSPSGYSNVVDVYDASSNTWSTIAPLSIPRMTMSAASAAGKIVFAGGFQQSGPFNQSDRVDIYDTATNTWSTHTLANPRYNFGMTAVGNKVYLQRADSATGLTVDVYDAVANTWSTISGFTNDRAIMGSASAANKAIFAGGYLFPNYFNAVDLYTDQSGYQTITSTKTFTLVADTAVAGRVALNAGSSLNLGVPNPFNLTIGSLSGSGGMSSSTGTARTLTVGGDGTSSSYSGLMTLAQMDLVKTGAGTLTLTSTSSSNRVRTATVNQGKLHITGALRPGTLTVNGGAALSGTGSINDSTTVVGGNDDSSRGFIDLVNASIGTLTFSNTTASAFALTIGGMSAGQASELDFEVGATADKIAITTAKLLVNPGGGLIEIVPLSGFGPGTYDLITFPAGQASGLENLTLGTTSLPGYTLALQTTATSEQLVVSVPEPAMLLSVTGPFMLAATLRRRRARMLGRR